MCFRNEWSRSRGYHNIPALFEEKAGIIIYILLKSYFWSVLLSDLADEFLTGKGYDMCRKIVLPLLD